MRITSRGGLLLLYALVMVGLPTSRAGGAGRAAATLSQAEVSQPLADQVKVLSDQIIALQKMIASQQGAILDLQQNLKKMQDDLTALKRAQAAAKPAPPALKLTAIAGNPILGDAKAPVTIIEFSDFQCPYCGRWFHDTLPQLKKDYIDTGKVRLAFRDLPLSSIHPRAMPAALAAECAHEQGRFWEFHDLLFNNQKQMTDENFAKWAGDLKLDTTGFLSCYTTQKYKAEIDGDAGEAAKIGVNGTPGFIFGRTRPDGTLEGQYISGAQPYALFAQAIEAVMKTPPPPPPAPPKAGPSTSGPGLP